jgi:hypothetical protein
MISRVDQIKALEGCHCFTGWSRRQQGARGFWPIVEALPDGSAAGGWAWSAAEKGLASHGKINQQNTSFLGMRPSPLTASQL